jgi:phosphohistidine phosphatase
MLAMKNLLLIRHAKSSWDDVALSDRERPLNKRGKHDAPVMGQLLKEKNLMPDVIVSSPAKRALKTAKLIAEAVGYPKKQIDIRDAIYEHGLDALLELIAGLNDDGQRVFLVGHNPEITTLANRLSGADIENVPTCGIVSITFPQDHWREAVQTGGTLAFFARPPKQLVDDAP